MLSPSEEVELLRLLEAERRDDIWATMSDGQRYVVEKIANSPHPKEELKRCSNFELRFFLQYCEMVYGPENGILVGGGNGYSSETASLDIWEASYAKKQKLLKERDEHNRKVGHITNQWEFVEVRPGFKAWQTTGVYTYAE